MTDPLQAVDKDRDPWTLVFEGALAIKDPRSGKTWKDGYGILTDRHCMQLLRHPPPLSRVSLVLLVLLFEKETTPTGTIIKYAHMIKVNASMGYSCYNLTYILSSRSHWNAYDRHRSATIRWFENKT